MPAGANIEIEPLSGGEFRVRVSQGRSRTVHRVRIEPSYYQQLTGGKISPEELLGRSFEFLLRREPNQSILPRFELSEIASYFPEYEREIQGGLKCE